MALSWLISRLRPMPSRRATWARVCLCMAGLPLGVVGCIHGQARQALVLSPADQAEAKSQTDVPQRHAVVHGAEPAIAGPPQALEHGHQHLDKLVLLPADLCAGLDAHAAASSCPLRASSIHCSAVWSTSRRLVRGMLMLCRAARWRRVSWMVLGSWLTVSWAVSSAAQGRAMSLRMSRCWNVPSSRSWVWSSRAPVAVSWSLMPLHLHRWGHQAGWVGSG